MIAHTPAFEEFKLAYESGVPQIVARSIVADLETPVSAWLKLGEGEPYSFLLESVQGGDSRGRYSIIGLRPDIIWRCREGVAELNVNADKSLEDFAPESDPPLQSLRMLIKKTKVSLPHSLPPMTSGLFGYLGHDMVRLMERLPQHQPDSLGLPDSILVRPTVVAIFDAVKADVTIATPVFPDLSKIAREAYDFALERLAVVAVSFARPVSNFEVFKTDPGLSHKPESNTSPSEYLDIVLRAKEYIRDQT